MLGPPELPEMEIGFASTMVRNHQSLMQAGATHMNRRCDEMNPAQAPYNYMVPGPYFAVADKDLLSA